MRNLTLSTQAELEEDALGFLFALVLNFLPTLGAMTKDGNKNNKQNKGHIALRSVRDKITCNLKYIYIYIYMMHDI